VVLTRNGPLYRYFDRRGTISVVSRGVGATGNERELFWTASDSTVDSSTCAVWDSGEGYSQQGAFFRMTDKDGVVRALTITRNVYGAAWWVFNFHYWDTSDSASPFILFAHVSLYNFLGRSRHATYPLHFCARVIGDVMQFIVWRPGQHRPAWGSEIQGGQAETPATDSYGMEAGVSGWYIGHVPPGTISVMSDMKLTS
jgi:hypothetical protein